MEIHREPVGRGQGNELVNKLEAAGLDSTLAQRVIDSKGNDLAAKVVRLISNGGFKPTTSQKRAREIMGRNMFGVEEAIRHFGVIPSRQQTAALLEIPFSEATLERCKKTHVLLSVFPLSILEINGKVASHVSRLFHNQDWPPKQAFAEEKGETEWKLVRKTSVDNSTGKRWPEQQALLANNEETPTTRVMVYTIIGHFLATGERLFKKIYVRCVDVARGCRVLVGNFDSDGLVVSWAYLDDEYDDDTGLSSARKSE